MRLCWSEPARQDILRLYDFLAQVNPDAAAAAINELVAAIEHLPLNPRLGRTLDAYRPRDIRRLVVGPYEVRYELRHDEVLVVRLFHGREDRQ